MANVTADEAFRRLQAAQDEAEQQDPAGSPPEAPRPAVSAEEAYSRLAQANDADQREVDRFNSWRVLNSEITPDRAGQVYLMQAAMPGADPFFINDNLEELSKDVDRQRLMAMAQRSDIIRQGLEDATKAPMVRDDAANLGQIEWWLTGKWEQVPVTVYVPNEKRDQYFPVERTSWQLKTAPGWVRALRDATVQQYATALAFKQGLGLAGPDDDAELERLDREYGEKDYGANFLPARLVVGAAKGIPYMAGNIAVRVAAGAAGTAVGSPIAGGVAAVGVGVAFDTYQNFGPLYRRLRTLKDADGQPLVSEDEARELSGIGSLLAGAISGGLMSVPLKAMPFGKYLVGDALEQALVKRGADELLRHTGKEYSKALAMGIGAMVVQNAANNGAEQIALGRHGQETDWGGALTSALVDGIVQGFEGMALLTAWQPMRTYVHELGLSRMVDENHARLQQVLEATQKTKLPPEVLEQLVASGGKLSQGGIDTLFADRERWDAYWTGRKLDPREAAARVLGDEGKAYDESTATKGPLKIPIEQYVARLGRTEHALALAEDLKYTPEGRTPREERALQDRIQARMKERAKVPADQLDAEERKVYDHFYQKARAAKVSHGEADANALNVAHAFEARAWEHNRAHPEAKVTSWEIANPFLARLSIHGPGDVAAAGRGGLASEGLSGPKRPEPPAVTKEREKYLAKAAEDTVGPDGKPVHGQTSDFMVDHGTGQYARRGFEVMSPPAGRPFLARFQREAVKLRNDKHTHLAVDGDLRQMGKVLRDAGIADGARDGTEVMAWVRDAAQAEELAAQMRAQEKLLKVTYAVAEYDGKSVASTIAAADVAHKGERDKMSGGEKPTLGHRKGIPAELAKGEPDVDWGTKEPLERRAGAKLHPKSPEGEAIKDRAAAKLAEFSERAKNSPMLDRPAMTKEHLEAFKKMDPLEAFDSIYRYPEEKGGLLTGDGAMMAQRLYDYPYQATLDGKGFAEVLEALGPEGIDAFAAEFNRVFREALGDEHNPARPHPTGDEWWAHGPDERKLTGRLEDLAAVGQNLVFVKRDVGGGRTWIKEGVSFDHGTGTDLAAAEKALAENRARLDREAADRGEVRNRPGRWLSDAEAEIELGRLAGAGRRLVDLGRQLHQGRDEASGRARGEGAGQRAPGEGVGEVAIPEVPGAKFHMDFSRGPKGERGFITFSGPLGEKGRTFDIHLLKGADESTLAHETFHWLTDVLHELAGAEGAPEGLRADYQKLVSFMGYGSAEERAAASRERWALQEKESRTPAEEKRLKQLAAKEERVTHGWEQYLAEGKAPTGELAGTFSRFKLWMLKIYKGMRGAQAPENIANVYRQRYGEELGLSDDVRRVFDRILVSDEQTRLAAQADGSQPLPAALERMTVQERAEYELAMELRRATAEQTLLAKLATSDQREKRAFFKQETRKVRAEVEAELDRDPVYRAVHFLKTGELRGPAGAIGDLGLLRDAQGAPLKLDRAELHQRYGKDFTVALERQHPGIVASKGEGGELAGIAMHLGFAGPDDLVRSLRFKDPTRGAATETLADLRPSRERLVGQEVSRRIQQVYGPALIDNPARLSEEAMSAVHNEARARAVLLELRAMRRAVDPSVGPEVRMADLATYRETARRLVEEKTVAEVAPSYYLQAERAAAKQAFEAAAAGKLEKAYDAKDAQLLNHELYRAAVEVRRELDSKFDQLARTARDAWRAELGKADPTYRDGHDSILEAVGLGPDQWMADAKRQSANALERALTQAANDVITLDFNAEALRELVARPRAWRALGVDEARNVFDAVKSLRHIANRINEVKLADKNATRAEIIERARQTLEKNLPKQPASPRSLAAASVTAAIRSGFQWADGMLLDIESMVEFMDGGKTGVMHDLILNPYLEARNHKAALGKQFLEKLLEHWEKMPKELREKRTEMVDLSAELPLPDKIKQAGNIKDGPITRADMWMIALNRGNEENRQRLRDGYEWTDAQIDQALQGKMSAAEWRWVQDVWNSLEGLYPLLAEVHEADTGLKPGKVKATTFQVLTSDGQMVDLQGGYFPLVYDRRAAEVGVKQEEQAVAQVMSPSYITPGTSKGHTRQRVTHFEGALKLDWSVVPSHVAQVLHDISFRQYVRQTAGVLMQPEMKGLLKAHLGEERTNQILPWLKAVASAQAEPIPAELSRWNKITSWVRNRLAVQALGHSLTNFAADLTNPALAAASGEVSVAQMTAALAKFTASPLEQRQFALEHSSELRYRAEHMSARLRLQLEQMGNFDVHPALRAIRDSAFALMEASDKLTATPVWLGKYSQELQAALAEHGDQVRAHAEAVKLANATIRKLFPPADAAEGPAILRNRQGLGSLLMFYGFFNKVYQAQRGLAHDAWLTWHDKEATVGDKLGTTAAAAGRLLAMALVTGVLAEGLAGKGPDKDQGDDWEKWLFRKALSAPFSSVPFAGPAVEQLLGGKRVSIRQAPVLSMAQESINKLGGLVEASLGDKDFNGDRAMDLVELVLGLGLNVPTRQARRTLSGLAHIGQEPPEDLADLGTAAGDLVYGPRRNETIGDLAGELVR